MQYFCMSCIQLFATLWTVAHQAPLWDSPGKNTGVGCHALLQGIFSTQGLNLCLLHCRQILYPLSHLGSPNDCRYVLGVQTWGLLLGWQQGSKMRKSHQGINCAYVGIGRHFMREKAPRESVIRLPFLLLKLALEHRAWVCSKMGFPLPTTASGHRQWTSCWGSASGKQMAGESPGEWPLPVGAGSRKERGRAGCTLRFIPNCFLFCFVFLNFLHLMWTADSLEKTLMLERLKAKGEGSSRGWDCWIASPTECMGTWANSGR